VVALMINRRETFMSKVEFFARQAGHASIVLMMFIFLHAGAFSKTTEALGGVTYSVNLGFSFIPQTFLIVGLFFICIFISILLVTFAVTSAAFDLFESGIC
ncbi:Na+/H+ antiporter NhaC family protein, partial [Staphylococcus pseudintermedius]